jgi:hypothetical protein
MEQARAVEAHTPWALQTLHRKVGRVRVEVARSLGTKDSVGDRNKKGKFLVTLSKAVVSMVLEAVDLVT